MKYLFISGLYPRREEEFFLKNSKSGFLQNAPNVFQWSVVDGLVKNKVEFSVLSAPFISSFPKGFKKFTIPSFPICYGDSIIGRTIPYCNCLGIKESSIKRSVLKGIREWIKTNSITNRDRFAIITYTPLSFFLSAVCTIKQEYPRAIICSIITDLIEDAHNFKVNQTIFKKIQISLERKSEQKLFKCIDKFVLLSKAMVERIPEADGKFVVIEGISIVCDRCLHCSKDSTVKSLLYSGSLHEFAGIKNLVKAFMNTKSKDFRLIICGKGQCEGFIKEQAMKDSRIKYLGPLKREEVLKQQCNATALINPRQPIEEITRFSFPSKTMEYLSSGTPMIGYQLEGIPDDYYDYYFSPSGNSVEELSDIINKVLSMSTVELNSMGERAYLFIKENKNSRVQVGKIINYIGE